MKAGTGAMAILEAVTPTLANIYNKGKGVVAEVGCGIGVVIYNFS